MNYRHTHTELNWTPTHTALRSVASRLYIHVPRGGVRAGPKPRHSIRVGRLTFSHHLNKQLKEKNIKFIYSSRATSTEAKLNY